MNSKSHSIRSKSSHLPKPQEMKMVSNRSRRDRVNRSRPTKATKLSIRLNSKRASQLIVREVRWILLNLEESASC